MTELFGYYIQYLSGVEWHWTWFEHNQGIHHLPSCESFCGSKHWWLSHLTCQCTCGKKQTVEMWHSWRLNFLAMTYRSKCWFHLGSNEDLQVSVLWHWPDPSTLTLANGSGKRNRSFFARFLAHSTGGLKEKEININKTCYENLFTS